MKSCMKKIGCFFVLLLFVFHQVIKAQGDDAEKLTLVAGFDLATSYLWRGFEIGKGPVVQPWARLGFGGWSAGVWASSNFGGDSKEIDLSIDYNVENFTLSLTDYFSMGAEGLDPNYFHFGRWTSSHIAELGLSYGGSELFPLTLYGGVFIYGAVLDPNPDAPARFNHSSYFEIGYPGTIKEYSYTIFAGFVPTKSDYYETKRFSFINVGCTLSRDIPIIANFSIPTCATLAVSPERKTVCLSVMCSF